MRGEDIGIITLIVFAGTAALVLVRAIARRMEASVESIAIEVERISESQRFLTKLLADRERTALPASAHGDQK